jgi:hypothetical protein
MVLLLLTCTNLLLLAQHSARGRMWEPPSNHPRQLVRSGYLSFQFFSSSNIHITVPWLRVLLFDDVDDWHVCL